MPVAHSAYLDAAVLGSYPLAVRVDYRVAGGAWIRMDNALVGGNLLTLTDGSVTSVRDGRVRRTATLVFGGTGAIPVDTLTHPISPLNRYRVYRGAKDYRGTEDFVCLGTFDPRALTVDRPSGTVTMELSDFGQRIDDDALQVGVEVDDTVKCLDVIKRLLISTDAQLPGVIDPAILPTLPGFTLTVGPGVDPAMLMPEGVIFDVGASSRGDSVDQVASFLDSSVVFDELGGLTIVRRMVTITPAPTPTYIFKPGGAGVGNYTELSSGWSFDGFANDVSITNGDFVVSQLITQGPFTPAAFGRSVRYSEDVSDQGYDEAATADYAARIAAEHLGLARQVTGTCVVVPWLVGGDVVQINYPTGSPIVGMLDSFTVPLGATESSSFQLREYHSTTGL
jgi:hypothetical protein